jgi:uncharacterized protein (TIGR00290 family)
MKKAFFNWSGGKDSALALYKLLNDSEYKVEALLTNVSDQFDRISMHGVRKELLIKQTESLDIPLHTLKLTENISMNDYDEIMKHQLSEFTSKGFTHSIFGDIFLEDLKKYREEKLSEVGLKGVFPLWKMDTLTTVKEFIDLGFKAIVVCANAKLLDESFVGREINHSFLADLPAEVDPCGENGEFHSFVYDGPIFSTSIPITIGDKVIRHYQEETEWDSSFWYCDLVLSSLK